MTTLTLDLPREQLKVKGEHKYEADVDPSIHEFKSIGITAHLNRYGNESGDTSYRWTVFKCNDPDCPAEVLVPTSLFEDAVNAAVTVSVG